MPLWISTLVKVQDSFVKCLVREYFDWHAHILPVGGCLLQINSFLEDLESYSFHEDSLTG